MTDTGPPPQKVWVAGAQQCSLDATPIPDGPAWDAHLAAAHPDYNPNPPIPDSPPDPGVPDAGYHECAYCGRPTHAPPGGPCDNTDPPCSGLPPPDPPPPT